MFQGYISEVFKRRAQNCATYVPSVVNHLG